MSFDAKKLDYAVLGILKSGYEYPTYVLRNILDEPCGQFYRSGLRTSHVLTACKRLWRAGKIQQMPRMSTNSYVWRLSR